MTTQEERFQSNVKKLPGACYAVAPQGLPCRLILIHAGVTGYTNADDRIAPGGTPEDAVAERNGILEVTPPQREAMLAGSMFGFHTPAADPNSYNPDGSLKEHIEPNTGEPLPADSLPPGPMTGLTEADIYARDAAAEKEEEDDEFPYPEHDKMKAVKERSQAIGEFLEWLREDKRLTLCCQHIHAEDCYNMGLSQEEFARKHGRRGDNTAGPSECVLGRFNVAQCGAPNGHYFPAMIPVEKLLAEHFDIDLAAVEAEKRAMLDAIRKRG